MFGPIILSVKVALLATVIAFFLGVFFAYLLTKRRVPGKNIWETILILPMILPPSIVGYLLLKVFGKRGLIGAFLLDTFGIQVVFTWIACVIAASVVALPLMYQNAKGAFQSVDPSLELAAKTLGSSPFKVFCTVTFPLSGPGIISGIVLTFARALGEFGATLMLAGNIPGEDPDHPDGDILFGSYRQGGQGHESCRSHGGFQLRAGIRSQCVAEEEKSQRQYTEVTGMSVSFRLLKKLNYFSLDVDFAMGNELLVIEGVSGAGKTTILNCLAGIAVPDEGEIIVDERLIFSHTDKVNVPAEKRNIGYLFQNYALFPHMTVKQNVLYGLKNRKEYWRKAEKKELLEYAGYMMETLGISHLTDKNSMAISGGEKQRVALARAMVTKPSLLLLDEPFSALDENTKNRIYDEFRAFRETLKIPTILITHNHREAELFADKNITLKEGKVV